MMYYRLLFVLFVAVVFICHGCGGGGGGGGATPTGPDITPTTIEGNVVLPEINSSLVGSIRAVPADQIDYSKLSIEVDGIADTKTTLSGIGRASFRLQIRTLTRNTARLLVRNKNGSTLAACQLEGLTQGGTISNITVDATSTAIVRLLDTDANFTVSDIESQKKFVATQFATLVNAIVAFLKDQTTGSPFDTSAPNVATAVVNVASAIRPGISEIKAAYEQMRQALESTTLTDEQRLQQFMSNISSDFKDIAGNPSYDDLRNTTRSRMDRYTINTYNFTPTAFTYTATDTIKVTTTVYVDVTRKPGKEGGVSGAKITVTPVPEITWKWFSAQNRWLIIQGLPYKQSEINI